MKIELEIALYIDDAVNPYHGKDTDSSEVEWFENHLLGDELILHSNLLGAEVGRVRVMRMQPNIRANRPDPAPEAMNESTSGPAPAGPR